MRVAPLAGRRSRHVPGRARSRTARSAIPAVHPPPPAFR